MAELQPYRGGYYLWHYVPSLPAAVIFCIIFFLLTASACYILFRTKTWFCIPFVLGGLFEGVGYAARASAYSQTGKLMPFAIQNAYILLGPPLFAATLYMAFGRLITQTNTQANSLIPTRWLTKIFVGFDVLSIVIQSGASGLMVTGQNAVLGKWLVIIGLLLQVIGFGVFMAVGVIWRRRSSRSQILQSTRVGWLKTSNTLGVCSLLIFIRSVFRVVEYATGTEGYLLTHEWPLYVFDTILMVPVMAIFMWCWIGDSELGEKFDRVDGRLDDSVKC